MRNPTSDELTAFRAAMRALSARQVEQQRELRPLIDAADDAAMALQALCDTPAGAVLSDAGTWVDRAGKPLVTDPGK